MTFWGLGCEIHSQEWTLENLNQEVSRRVHGIRLQFLLINKFKDSVQIFFPSMYGFTLPTKVYPNDANVFVKNASKPPTNLSFTLYFKTTTLSETDLEYGSNRYPWPTKQMCSVLSPLLLNEESRRVLDSPGLISKFPYRSYIDTLVIPLWRLIFSDWQLNRFGWQNLRRSEFFRSRWSII